MALNTLTPKQNDHHFVDNIFKFTLMNEKIWVSIEMSLKIFTDGPINNMVIWRDVEIFFSEILFKYSAFETKKIVHFIHTTMC